MMVALLFGIVTDYLIFFLSRFRAAIASGREPEAAAIERHRRTDADHLHGGVLGCRGLGLVGRRPARLLSRLWPRPGAGRADRLRGGPDAVPGAAGDGRQAAVLADGPGPADRESGRGRPASAAAAAGGDAPGAAATAGGGGRRWPLCRCWRSAPCALKLSLANTLISGLPADSPPKQAFRLAASDFPAGAISPTMVLVEGDRIAERRAKLQRLRALLADRRNVASTIGPGTVPQAVDLGATVSPTGNAVRYLLVFDLDPARRPRDQHRRSPRGRPRPSCSRELGSRARPRRWPGTRRSRRRRSRRPPLIYLGSCRSRPWSCSWSSPCSYGRCSPPSTWSSRACSALAPRSA